MKMKFLSACMLSAAIVAAPMTLHADMVNTHQLLTSEQRSMQMDLVETFMAREEVRNQIESLGVDPALAAERVAGLTDFQLQQLARNIQESPAGSGAVGIVLGVLLIILLLEILGLTNVSSKI